MAAGAALGRGFPLVYTAMFLRTLKRKCEAKAMHYREAYDLRVIRRARTLREFDNVVTAPLHGFRDTDDYWTRASAKPLLRSVRVPTLLLNARNDPFLPEAALPSQDEVADCVVREFPAEGGHVGFVSSGVPGDFGWFTQRIIDFVSKPGAEDRAPVATLR